MTYNISETQKTSELEKSVNSEVKDNNSNTPLHLAVDKKQISIIKDLLEKGVRIDIKDNNGHTVLDMVFGQSVSHEIRELILAKADNINEENTPPATSNTDRLNKRKQSLESKGNSR